IQILPRDEPLDVDRPRPLWLEGRQILIRYLDPPARPQLEASCDACPRHFFGARLSRGYCGWLGDRAGRARRWGRWLRLRRAAAPRGLHQAPRQPLLDHGCDGWFAGPVLVGLLPPWCGAPDSEVPDSLSRGAINFPEADVPRADGGIEPNRHGHQT